MIYKHFGIKNNNFIKINFTKINLYTKIKRYTKLKRQKIRYKNIKIKL